VWVCGGGVGVGLAVPPHLEAGVALRPGGLTCWVRLRPDGLGCWRWLYAVTARALTKPKPRPPPKAQSNQGTRTGPRSREMEGGKS
jgi:hypothetical protein